MYTLIRFIHILAAVIAVGTGMTYGLLLARAHREPPHLRHVLDSIRILDRRLANPGYAVVLITGLLMVRMGPVAITTPWLLISIVLYLGVAALGAAALAPTVRAQMKALQEQGADSAAYRGLRDRTTRLIWLATALVLIILYLMVAKPGSVNP